MLHNPRLVILGRDGILNVYREDHVKAPEEWQPVPGALEAVARLNHAGWHVVVATNQAGIGRGMIDMASLNSVHQRMMQRLAAVGGRLDAVFFCPHTPEDNCECRKPRPGLMKQIGSRYGIELRTVPMVCDTLRDLLAAQAAGCEPHLVRSGRAAGLDAARIEAMVAQVPGTEVHADLGAFVDFVLQRAHLPDSGPIDLN
ncbi:MAG: D-glycero-beta-D-manno-heptose-1,7-bisphosphate 7-phosphatase [Burkholderiaceae bacterium]|nr:D-glycero-beta-D-manno-heptose-1,7-bisphosphate 7-phosphatase [Burkholderiaceae bacterium]